MFTKLLSISLLAFMLMGAGYLPRDKSREVIQGTAPDVLATVTIGATGSATLDVTNDITVRFKCDYPVTYHFGVNTTHAWPVPQNQEEYIIIPNGRTTMTFLSSTNPTTCNIQESRK